MPSCGRRGPSGYEAGPSDRPARLRSRLLRTRRLLLNPPLWKRCSRKVSSASMSRRMKSTIIKVRVCRLSGGEVAKHLAECSVRRRPEGPGALQGLPCGVRLTGPWFHPLMRPRPIPGATPEVIRQSNLRCPLSKSALSAKCCRLTQSLGVSESVAGKSGNMLPFPPNWGRVWARYIETGNMMPIGEWL